MEMLVFIIIKKYKYCSNNYLKTRSVYLEIMSGGWQPCWIQFLHRLSPSYYNWTVSDRMEHDCVTLFLSYLLYMCDTGWSNAIHSCLLSQGIYYSYYKKGPICQQYISYIFGLFDFIMTNLYILPHMKHLLILFPLF